MVWLSQQNYDRASAAATAAWCTAAAAAAAAAVAAAAAAAPASERTVGLRNRADGWAAAWRRRRVATGARLSHFSVPAGHQRDGRKAFALDAARLSIPLVGVALHVFAAGRLAVGFRGYSRGRDCVGALLPAKASQVNGDANDRGGVSVSFSKAQRQLVGGGESLVDSPRRCWCAVRAV